jgi:xylulokinase
VRHKAGWNEHAVWTAWEGQRARALPAKMTRFISVCALEMHFLGLDSSTQSLTGVLVFLPSPDDVAASAIVWEASVNFQERLPHYQTTSGVIKDGAVVQAPPLMWVEALDLLLHQLTSECSKGVVSSITGVAVSGQQHGTVYLNENAASSLSSLVPAEPLVEQLKTIFSRDLSPIWMDASTQLQVQEITTALGGADEACKLTGSAVFERFSGPQIRKFATENPDRWAATRHVCLVSSFMTSVLAGKICAIDAGDGSGMSLMNIRTKEWSERALRATADGLCDRLLPVAPCHEWQGSLSSYFVQKYGFPPECRVLSGTGDNPSALIGLGLVEQGRMGISLGTSDVVSIFMPSASLLTDPDLASHIFAAPTGDYMALSVYKNGSLARECVKQQCGMTEWSEFDAALCANPPGNRGRLMLPYFDTEIIPRVSTPCVTRANYSDNSKEDSFPDVRACVEAQCASMRLHSRWMGSSCEARLIHATGGGSGSQAMLQTLADVFGVNVVRQHTRAAAALGAAVRALHAHTQGLGVSVSWSAVVRPHMQFEVEIQPRPEAAAACAVLVAEYEKLESEFARKSKNPH